MRISSGSSAARWPARPWWPPAAPFHPTGRCTRCTPTSSAPYPGVPIVYTVDRIRDGRSFTTRRAVAVQHGRAIFALSVSFLVAERGPEYQEAPMPEAPDPETVPVWQERLKGYGPRVPARRLRPRPVEVRYVGDPPWAAQADGGPRAPHTMVWLRAHGSLPDEPLLHVCAATYASDLTLLDAVLLGHGLAWDERSVTGASLDHAMWSHGPFRADQWLLYVQESPLPRVPAVWPWVRSSRTAGSLPRSFRRTSSECPGDGHPPGVRRT
jgi:acyl-CoA thioesterase II